MRQAGRLLLVVGWGLWGVTSAAAQEAEGRSVSEGSRPMVTDALLEQRWDGIERERQADVRRSEARSEAEAQALFQPGRRVFVFGSAEAFVVVCQPLRVCDIELQAGEVVQGVHLGDAVRWTVGNARSGVGRQRRMHLIVKPQSPGLHTNLTVYTDRRTYFLQLRSTGNEHMPSVVFHYPEDFNEQWNSGTFELAQRQEVEASPAAPGRGEGVLLEVNPGQLNFGYDVEKQGRRRHRRSITWAPLRVYDDGEKTIVEMPESMLTAEAPVLLVREDGEERIVNYRIRGRYYIVDRLFREAVLIMGVGRDQQEVVIRREED